MTFWDHLDELRERLIRCAWVFFGGFGVAYYFSDHILDFLRKPLFQYLPPERQHLYYTGLFENFFVHLRISGYSSILFLSPVYFFILWGFIAPGLHPHERKKFIPFVSAASLFFILGSAFAYFVLFPAGVKYFLNYGTQAEVAWLTLENYISLVLKMLVGFGLAFQLPVVIVLLSLVGVISAEQLKKNRRIAIVVITIVAALVAPPDAISMLLLMAPLYLLYEGAIVAVRVLHRDVPKDPSNTTES